ncbi:MAG: Uma2 family endonuclease [Mogibacterium sp.]|nr:Uma2 family endonuclease [Mogibacterium sp.]
MIRQTFDLSKLKARKKALSLTNQDIAEESGVPLSTVQKVFAGQTASPRYDTLAQIDAVLTRHERRQYSITPERDTAAVHESNLAYRYDYATSFDQQAPSDDAALSFYKLYTLEDYYAFPDDRRVELIDGRIYDMTAPTIRHQDIILQVAIAFYSYIEKSGHDCRAIVSPVDVRLDCDNYTMVEPDLVVLCNRGRDDRRLKNTKRVEGAPDFIMEVLSPSSVGLDSGLKYRKYKGAGVREYWIVDPGIRKVTVCDFEHDRETQYTFDDAVPVCLTGGDLRVDFAKINAYMTE